MPAVDVAGEFETIRRLFAPLAHPEWGRGLADDVAVVPSRAGYDLVLTKDALVEGVERPTLVEVGEVDDVTGVAQLVGEGGDARGQALGVVEEQDLRHLSACPCRSAASCPATVTCGYGSCP